MSEPVHERSQKQRWLAAFAPLGVSFGVSSCLVLGALFVTPAASAPAVSSPAATTPQTTPTQATPTPATPAQTIKAQQAKRGLKKLLGRLPSTVKTTYFVQDLRTGKVLEKQDIQTPYIPASTMKLLVGATFLQRRAGGWWSSELTVPATEEGKSEVSTLTLRSNADPTLQVIDSTNSVRFLVKQVFARGIRQVGQVRLEDGNVKADEFQQLDIALSMPEVRVDVWEDRPPVSAESARERLGRALIAELREVGIEVVDKEIGSVKRQKPYEPPKEYDEEGQLLPRPVQIPLDKRPDIAVASVRGDEIIDYLSDTLRPSHNLRAETLFAGFAARVGTKGSVKSASQEVLRFLKQNGIPVQGVRVADGSGLSDENKLTAQTLAGLLRLMYDLPYTNQTTMQAMREHKTPEMLFFAKQNIFVEALAKAGVGGSKYGAGGTLAQRMRNTGLDVRAKTGTLMGVSCLAGYVVSESGRPLSFVIMMNGPDSSPILDMRAIQDQMVGLIAETY